ncbi:endonuclease MutS2 [Spirosoma utsteinense]|uniref:Endonuclease MutS2 n=1 Tax=Spirosoma utsteinense TaxID=2585773 RepID=A0ABR6W0D7_9BACT|nr:endonuclease MutS2 [Spirosoma utsteinense]MBC3788134.1 DNA mismatch repair protein MutS2 [Spirosoma utsteinense]MBC3790005.1 DNA mismatch repair protein MutS2 [Spirosoma utsteinense]
MLYPTTLESKLGFDKIRELIKQACISPLGQDYVDRVRFSDNHALIDKLLRQTYEFKQIVQYETDFPQSNYIDVREQLSRARVEGLALTEQEFFDLKLALRTIQDCLRFLEKQEDETPFPYLKEMAGPVSVDKNLVASLDRIIDDRGLVRDSASPELSSIRRRIISEQANLRKRLDTIVRQARQNGWIPDDLNLTVRGGRLVIPIAAEHKRKIKGFVHDESQTGQTVFLEPAEVFDANNEVRELEYAERREIYRILLALTDQVRPHLEGLKRAVNFLGQIDFIRAKAKLAIQLDAGMPMFHNRPVVNWINARHPLLHLSFTKQGKQVVPLSIELNEQQRILIISGPNAGGKSVALKTIGLIQYMLQCGLLVPLTEYSDVGVFQNLFIDIGDEQSLENDLSTYSSHLTAMKQFLIGAHKRTLFLIDEFGTGTEPGLGGAVAESILEDLNKSGAYGVINTHYTNLKVFADKTPGLINGAMRFDGEHLEPLYQLETGRPGSSFAFEIAQKIGLPKGVIDRAKEKLGTQQVNFEKLLKELDIEKRVFSEKNLEISINQRKVAQQLAEYTALKTKLDNEQKQLLNDAKQKAKALVQEANQRIESTIREIKESKAEREPTRQIRQELERFEQKALKPEVVAPVEKPKPAEPEFETDNGVIGVGSYVRIIGQNAIGEVLSLRGKDVELRIGDLKTNIKLNRLEKVSKRTFKEATDVRDDRPRSQGMDLNEKMLNFSFNLDIRGKRGEEAIGEVDRFFDDALMLGYPELRIVHGKGDGILRTLVRNHLRGYKQVGKMEDEHADRGGAGVTIVKMK